MKARILRLEACRDHWELAHPCAVGDETAYNSVPVRTRGEFIAHLRRRDFDLILADCGHLGGMTLQALELARKHAPEIPFIFASGPLAAAGVVESLWNGAGPDAEKNGATGGPPTEAVPKKKNREAEKRLGQAQNLEAVATLAGGIAHDFNNILTIIKGHASLLEGECDRPARVCEVAGIIDHAARRGADLVKEMLAFAQKGEGIFSLCDFNKLVRETVAMLRGSIPRPITLEFAFDESLPPTMLDAGQIERVVLNLVGNARDAMPRGGRIVVSTGRITDSLTVPALADLPARDYVYLQISDSGDGMDEKTRSRIFEPFFTTKPKGKGTGLGMPVVYGIVQMHHGAIDVVSAVGKGTSVEIYLPLVLDTDHRGPRQKPVEPRVRGGTETLLVVDDEPDVLSFLRSMLELEGYHVLTAESAEEAIAVFAEHRDEISLVFSDLGLPNLDGYDLGERLRQMKPGLKALLGSGFADAEVKRRVQENAYTQLLSKPYSPAGTLAAIRTALDSGATEQPRKKGPGTAKIASRIHTPS